MLEDKEMVEVRNLVDHMVVYKIDELNRRVVFNPFETKKVPVDELRRLNYQTGGQILLHNYLCILNNELRQEFNIDPTVIEYDWTIKDIDAALTSSPIDELLDALEFGPEGIKNMLVDRAVQLKIPDTNRRKAIQEITGVDVNNMINFKEQAEAIENKNAAAAPHTRRSSQSVTVGGRRVRH